jgi:hypothetical protein
MSLQAANNTLSQSKRAVSNAVIIAFGGIGAIMATMSTVLSWLNHIGASILISMSPQFSGRRTTRDTDQVRLHARCVVVLTRVHSSRLSSRLTCDAQPASTEHRIAGINDDALPKRQSSSAVWVATTD